MPLKLKLPGGDSSKRSKTPQSHSTKSPSHHPSPDRKCPPSKSQRHHSSNVVESVAAASSRHEDFPPVFDGTNNNCSPVGSPQSAPENYANFPQQLVDPRRRPKSMSEPLQPEDVGVRSKESKPGKNRAFSVSRSGKFKEAKRRTSLLEIQDRFDNAAKGDSGNLGSPHQDKL